MSTNWSDPPAQVEDSHKLTADGYVDLFEITLLTGSVLYLKSNDTVIYRSRTYQGTAIKISGVEKYADEKDSRPQMVMVNPDGIYGEFIKAGLLDYALVKRIRVLREDLLANRDVKTEQRWRIWRISALTNEAVTCELRSVVDRFNALIPGRMFIPPEFPLVTLQ